MTNQQNKLADAIKYISSSKFVFGGGGQEALLLGDVAELINILMGTHFNSNTLVADDIPMPILSKPIDNVTIQLLQSALNSLGFEVEREIVDVIIDVVELIEDKGDNVTLGDLEEIKINHYL